MNLELWTDTFGERRLAIEAKPFSLTCSGKCIESLGMSTKLILLDTRLCVE